MIKFIYFLFCYSVSFMIFSENIPPEIKRIRDKRVLTISMYKEDIPPFFMNGKDGELTGFDVDLGRDIASRLHVTADFQRIPKTFDEVVTAVVEKKADIGISLLSNTLGRAQIVAFTNTYVNLKQVLVNNRLRVSKLKKGNDIFKLFNDPDVILGVLTGSSYVEYARDNFPNVSLILYNDSESLFKAAYDGSILGLFTDEIDVRNWFDSNPESGISLQINYLKNKNDPLAIAVNWENKHLLLWLNFYLKRIEEDGTLKSLKEKYNITG